MAGAVIAVAALADLLCSRRRAWERASSAPLFADQECGPTVGRVQVVSRLVFHDGPGSAIEEEPRKEVCP